MVNTAQAAYVVVAAGAIQAQVARSLVGTVIQLGSQDDGRRRRVVTEREAQVARGEVFHRDAAARVAGDGDHQVGTSHGVGELVVVQHRAGCVDAITAVHTGCIACLAQAAAQVRRAAAGEAVDDGA